MRTACPVAACGRPKANNALLCECCERGPFVSAPPAPDGREGGPHTAARGPDTAPAGRPCAPERRPPAPQALDGREDSLHVTAAAPRPLYGQGTLSAFLRPQPGGAAAAGGAGRPGAAAVPAAAPARAPRLGELGPARGAAGGAAPGARGAGVCALADGLPLPGELAEPAGPAGRARAPWEGGAAAPGPWAGTGGAGPGPPEAHPADSSSLAARDANALGVFAGLGEPPGGGAARELPAPAKRPLGQEGPLLVHAGGDAKRLRLEEGCRG